MPDSSTHLVNGTIVPGFLYGTAWKEDRTQSLVELALDTGFRGIDTANQRRHYHEAAVGAAIAAAVVRGVVSRDDLFLQTKFTFRNGQDHRLPYDPTAPIATQVEQSLASSRQHLGVDHLDSYMLHGPSQRSGLGADDWAAWRAMERLHDGGAVRLLGISNVGLDQIQQLCDQATVRPTFVQNRCYARLGWDREIREFCRAHQIIYQGFSLLTANREVLMHPEIRRIASQYQRTPCQIIFRFALEIGMLPLTGTSSGEHMHEDLAVLEFELTPEEVTQIERLAG
ncbi:MAG TPA: aldo/keto reductase [Chthoniobacteraceae bacterium]|nr:aldo/keto reductase [Chthoniobacteraceae bacterium]